MRNAKGEKREEIEKSALMSVNFFKKRDRERERGRERHEGGLGNNNFNLHDSDKYIRNE
jgi:hypothetical protein